MVEVNNLTTVKIDKNLLKKTAEKVLAKRNFDLSIALVDEKRIKELNKVYRKKDKPTDVLSFNYQTQTHLGAGGKENEVLFDYKDSGEIVLCPKQIKGEIGRVLIHGILHLLGYDHEKSKRAAERMQKRENYYLSKI